MTLSSLFLGERAEAKPGEPSQYSILLVDDEPSALSALKRVFRQESYRLLTASSGAEALEILDREEIQLIISDHRMPGMTGAELLTSVRTNWPDTIRIMLTGFADVESIMGAVKEGAVFKFMTKPWQDDDLRITTARALEQYELRKEVRALRTQNQLQEEKLAGFSSVLSEDRGPLAKILLRQNKITAQEYEQVLKHQRQSPGLVYRTLLDVTSVSEDDIANVLQKTLGVDPVDLREVRISPEAAGLLSGDFCSRNLVLPLKFDDGKLTLAMADPSDILKRGNIEALLGFRLIVVLAKGRELIQKASEVYGGIEGEASSSYEAIDEIDIVIEEEEMADETDVKDLLRSSAIPPVVRIVNAILAEALRRGASDIHIEPRVKYTAVRYRIDGLLQDRMRLPSEIQPAVASRIKVLAKIDIAEKRRPQDGRITVRAPDHMVDVRVSSLPTLYGENIVLRLLDRGGSVRKIEAMGLDDANLERVRALVRRPQGIIVCTGPTGSGKTTMLYSLLTEHLNPTSSYGTIEDPVEYYIETASQVLVREKAGLTFPTALRSMLRQDPDVILVGEIRDCETAQIAFQAALTGHLVFSTLHTNNAVSTITRLVNLKVERYLIASGLECVIAQRLLRSVCPHCARSAVPDPRILELLDLRADDMPRIRRGVGCKECNDTGYVGRLGVFEVLEVGDQFKELILGGARELELAESAHDAGMSMLFDDAIRKVQRGLTTLEEVLRVLGPRIGRGRPCPNCNNRLEVSFKVCPFCGKVVRWTCGSCSMPLIDGWSFCPSCGGSCSKENGD